MPQQEEGIVAKQLESIWKPDDKSGSWLKCKPDYIHMNEVGGSTAPQGLGGTRRGVQGAGLLVSQQQCSCCQTRNV